MAEPTLADDLRAAARLQRTTVQANRLLQAADEIETLSTQVAHWNDLSGRVARQEFPLLPHPAWPQDVAYIAYVIDTLAAWSRPSPPEGNPG